MTLNKLEKAVLQEIRVARPEIALALDEQLDGIVVLNRENSGVGFFTTLQPKNAKLPIRQPRAISNIFAKIEGMQNPMTFVLFMKDGVIDMLEGASIDENTSDIDFSTATFEILPVPHH